MAERWEIEERKYIRRLRRAKKRRDAAKQAEQKAKKSRAKHTFDYRHRAKVLKAMGFASYADYLESDLWAGIRARVLNRDIGKCRLCGLNEARQAHHMAYDEATMKGECIEEIIGVCGGCHLRVEFRSGRKRSAYSAHSSTVSRLKTAEIVEAEHAELDAMMDAAMGSE